jgi:hypothetical protein
MTEQKISFVKKLPVTLAAAAGVVFVGLLAAPVASAHDASACSNVDPANGACLDQDPGPDRHSVPDPTKYGCPPRDFQCMFNHALPPK